MSRVPPAPPGKNKPKKAAKPPAPPKRPAPTMSLEEETAPQETTQPVEQPQVDPPESKTEHFVEVEQPFQAETAPEQVATQEIKPPLPPAQQSEEPMVLQAPPPPKKGPPPPPGKKGPGRRGVPPAPPQQRKLPPVTSPPQPPAQPQTQIIATNHPQPPPKEDASQLIEEKQPINHAQKAQIQTQQEFTAPAVQSRPVKQSAHPQPVAKKAPGPPKQAQAIRPSPAQPSAPKTELELKLQSLRRARQLMNESDSEEQVLGQQQHEIEEQQGQVHESGQDQVKEQEVPEPKSPVQQLTPVKSQAIDNFVNHSTQNEQLELESDIKKVPTQNESLNQHSDEPQVNKGQRYIKKATTTNIQAPRPKEEAPPSPAVPQKVSIKRHSERGDSKTTELLRQFEAVKQAYIDNLRSLNDLIEAQSQQQQQQVSQIDQLLTQVALKNQQIQHLCSAAKAAPVQL